MYCKFCRYTEACIVMTIVLRPWNQEKIYLLVSNAKLVFMKTVSPFNNKYDWVNIDARKWSHLYNNTFIDHIDYQSFNPNFLMNHDFQLSPS